jgi:hypothetical protein
VTNIELPDVGATTALLASLQANLPQFADMIDWLGRTAPALRRLGHIHRENGPLDTTATSFSATLSLTPEDSDLWRDLAGVHDASGHVQQTLSAIQRPL